MVDDEPGVRNALARGLTAEGMDVVAVGDGPSALHAAMTGSFDAVVLDIILPGLSGYRVLERLRAAGVDTPVLLVSAKDGEVDQADGLDLGADGYLVKPFSFVVLVAQLRAMLRRREGARAQRRIRLGALVVDPVARSVSWAGRAVELSPREFSLLHALLERPGAILSREQLENRIYGWGEEVTSNAVDVLIHGMRRKLGPEAIRNVRGLGWRVAPAGDGSSAGSAA